MTHSDALEFHSLFSTVYAPPATEAVCELHRVLAAWAAVAVKESAATAASAVAAAATGASIRLLVVGVRLGASRIAFHAGREPGRAFRGAAHRPIRVISY